MYYYDYNVQLFYGLREKYIYENKTICIPGQLSTLKNIVNLNVEGVHSEDLVKEKLVLEKKPWYIMDEHMNMCSFI
jgi:hypothetical protein